ncbi:prepilin-type N-terminal cleavage/methylation domain-containing protein [Clostridium oryzae]|uniref:Uncharacterized protein n=1 Tax=Clostridium oryzae TaxID=1450648 RepID=A0A1V4INZ3_9CLOT|nr:prepilin-type N-terminal cleavage/methylation domain-containing protein [Clostridium oryzae]OPJ61515.1 hypothetical protein CLORY_21970 [Clostridium oryzae]
MKELLGNKKKGMTLIEVIVTIAIFSIIIIPLSVLVTTAVKYNKQAENTQQVSLTAQKIIESIKADHKIEHNSIALRLTNSTQYLNKMESTTDASKYDIGYSIYDADIDVGNYITSDITFQRKRDIIYDLGQASAVSSDGTVTVKENNTLRLDEAGSSDNVYPMTGDLEIIGKDDTVILKNKSGEDIAIINKKAGSSGSIKIINMKTEEIHVYVRNDSESADKIFNILCCKNSSYGDIKICSEGGAVRKYLNVPSGNLKDNKNGVYDVNVKIYKNDGGKKKIYEITSSIDIEN